MLLSLEDTSKASSKTTFSNYRLSATAIFASGIASASALFASGILMFNSLDVSKDFLANYPVYSQIVKENGYKIMNMIAGALTAKLCETIPSFTELYNVGDGRKYVARPSLENIILQVWMIKVVSARLLLVLKEQENHPLWRACLVERKGHC
jgi:hypothetical protein